jgi:predicted branched-subunit amino acid permease
MIGAQIPPHGAIPMTVAQAIDRTDVGYLCRSPSSDVRDGVVAMAPFVVGLAPFALTIGAAAARTDDPLAGWSGSWLIFGGSAHLAVLRSIHAGLLVAVAGGLLIHARLLAYGASLARRWQYQPLWFRLAAAALVIDPTWAAAERHAASGASDAEHRRFFLAAGLALGVGWSALMGVGIVAGGRLDSIDLDVMVPLCLVALVAPALRDVPNRLPMIVAAAVALGGPWLPSGTTMLLAIVAGTLAGAAAGDGDGDGRAR